MLFFVFYLAWNTTAINKAAGSQRGMLNNGEGEKKQLRDEKRST